YFGDYYGPHYRQAGFFALYSAPRAVRGYDPLFSYYNVHYHRQNINYTNHLTVWHNQMEAHADWRPPRTYREQLTVVNANVNHPHHEHSIMGASITEVSRSKDTSLRVTRIADQERTVVNARIKQQRDIEVDRI